MGDGEGTAARSLACLVLFLLFFGFVVPSFSDPVSASPTKVAPRVMIVIFNPILEAQGNQRLVDFKGWNDPIALSQEYVRTMGEISRGFVDYKIRTTIEIDGYPAKDNGHVFSDEEYLDCLADSSGPNCASIIDYVGLLDGSGICSFVNQRRISEVWLWGGPWFGFYEAVQAGPDPIVTNGPPILGTSCERTVDIMGFSYERGLTEMIHDFSHRVEGNMDHVFGPRLPDESTPWNRFTLRDAEVPGRGGCGTVHHPVNTVPPLFDYTNLTTVSSSCDDFLNYPELSGTFADVNCKAWGCTQFGYLQWWLQHLPSSGGATDGKLNNWWAYVVHR